MNKKVFNHRSWTHWAGYLAIILPEVIAWMPTIEGTVDPEIYIRVTQALGLVMILLRNKTTTPIDQR